MATAFGLLRLSPRDFWTMTPRELERAMSVLRAETASAPGRRELSKLMNDFPDRQEDRPWPKT